MVATALLRLESEATVALERDREVARCEITIYGAGGVARTLNRAASGR